MILVMSWCVVTSRPPALLATSQMVTILGLCGCSASDRKAPFSLSFAPIGTSSSPGSAGGYAPCTDAGVKMPGTGKYLGVVGGNVLLRRQSTSWSSGHQPWQEPGGYGSMSSSDNDGAVVPRHPGSGEALARWRAGCHPRPGTGPGSVPSQVSSISPARQWPPKAPGSSISSVALAPAARNSPPECRSSYRTGKCPGRLGVSAPMPISDNLMVLRSWRGLGTLACWWPLLRHSLG